MHVQSCCFANLNLSVYFFFVVACRSRYCRRRRCLISALLLPSRNLATMVNDLMSHFSFLFNPLNKGTPFVTVFLRPLSVQSVRINGV